MVNLAPFVCTDLRKLRSVALQAEHGDDMRCTRAAPLLVMRSRYLPFSLLSEANITQCRLKTRILCKLIAMLPTLCRDLA